MYTNTFQLLKNASNRYITGLDRLMAGFQMLGLRLSENTLKNSILRWDATTQDNMANYKKAFFLALEEEIMANVLAFKEGLNDVK